MRFCIKGRVHDFPPTGAGFKYFVRFRHGGVRHVNGERQDINTWVGGWSNGTTAHLKEIDFRTGSPLREYTLADIKCLKHPTLS